MSDLRAKGLAVILRQRFLAVAAVTVGIVAPAIARADMVWPALFLEPRLLSIPVVGLGLIVEAAFLRFGFNMKWPRAIFVSLVVNAISAALGVVLIPLAGIAWEVFPGLLLYSVFHIGTFNPATWAGNYVLAVVVTTIVEVVCLRAIFKIPANRRTWVMWLMANAASVALAFVSLAIQPPDEGLAYRPWGIGEACCQRAITVDGMRERPRPKR